MGFVLCVAVAGAASAQVRPLTAGDVTTSITGVEMFAFPDEPSRLSMNTWRGTEITLWPTGFRMAMHYNGLDDRTWTFPRILDVLLAKACGDAAGGWASALVAQLYASPSLVSAQEWGADAGRSFKKVEAREAGACRVELLAEGARWHTLTATVSYGTVGPLPGERK